MERASHVEPEPVESLDWSTCRRLLSEGGVGVLGFASGADDEAPILRPVNFVLHAGAIYIRTGGGGTILAAAERSEPGSLALSGVDRVEHTGWSVVVIGKLTVEPTDKSTLALPLRAWASGTKDRHVSLSIGDLSGLRIPPGRGNR